MRTKGRQSSFSGGASMATKLRAVVERGAEIAPEARVLRSRGEREACAVQLGAEPLCEPSAAIVGYH